MSYCIINILANTTVLREFHRGEVVAKRLGSTDLLKTVRTNTQNLCGLQFRVKVAAESVSVSTSAVKDTEIANFWIYIQHPVDRKLIKIRASGAEHVKHSLPLVTFVIRTSIGRVVNYGLVIRMAFSHFIGRNLIFGNGNRAVPTIRSRKCEVGHGSVDIEKTFVSVFHVYNT